MKNGEYWFVKFSEDSTIADIKQKLFPLMQKLRADLATAGEESNVYIHQFD